MRATTSNGSSASLTLTLTLTVALVAFMTLGAGAQDAPATQPSGQPPAAPTTQPAGEEAAAPAAPTIPWVTDYARAKQQAAAEGKDLLINFTGSDWCGWCIRLEGEVFGQAAFLETATTQFVFVFLDFPRSAQAKEAVVNPELNERMQRDLGVEGFPTIVLATAAGAPYARTGYQAGGPSAYLAHLADLRSSGDKVKALLANQDAAKTVERLQAALPVLADQGFLHNSAYETHRKLAREQDVDGALGLLALAEAADQLAMAAKELAPILSYLGTLEEGQMPDWDKLHSMLLKCENVANDRMFLQVAINTAQWLREEGGKPAAARALFARVARDPIVDGNPQAMAMLQAEMDACDAAASQPKTPAPEAEAGPEETPRSKPSSP